MLKLSPTLLKTSIGGYFNVHKPIFGFSSTNAFAAFCLWS